jgi:NADH dehydrogenase/NADH:ubiquinone oxidoreductase subunit G
MTQLTINSRTVTARKSESLLAVARREGFDIPALCHHEAVEPFGACRLCLVEITKASWNGFTKLVTSCLYPAEEGLVVQTDSPRVRRARSEVLELLIARSPKAAVLRELGRKYGIEAPKYKVDDAGDNCILCGLCTRVCQAHVTSAISTTKRGVEKAVGTPFGEQSDTCVGCLSCAQVCPTGAIAFEQTPKSRTIWGKTFALVACPSCGAGTVPAEYAQWLASRTGQAREELALCDACKARKTADTYDRIAW